MIDLLLKNVKTDHDTPIIDIAIDNGFIVDRGPKLDYFACQIIDGKNQLVVPGFVDSHLHLDIALMNSWIVPGRQESFQSMKRLNDLVEYHRKGFSKQDIERRGRACPGDGFTQWGGSTEGAMPSGPRDWSQTH